ncbi:mus-41 [Symbiodinium pilosum]|uniref:Mus-41 protein n=1 Tax=Symbiodinium pilosum TaxID=2952 RepID=A0A812TVU3_SYMPI|nr:mus-41 [Symbiodinium pilosum]
MAWSTIRLGADQQFQAEDGSFGPLLRQGRRLELRWAVEAKKSRARPGTAASQVGAETGTIRFDAGGQEVGRFPADANKTLVPLLARRLIDVEAVVGRDPPRVLTLGTDLPVVVRVSLRSVALRTPGQIDAKPAIPEADGGKNKSKGQNQKNVHKEEADKEIQRTSTGMLLEKLNLPCRRRAALEGDVVANTAEELPAKAEGAGVADDEPEAEEEEMSKVAAAQLGRSDQLERHDLPGIVLPQGIFQTRLRPYQAQAVYWMWQRENPTSSLPSSFKNADPHGDEKADEATSSPNASQATKELPHERQLHPMWDEYELPEETGPLPGGIAGKREFSVSKWTWVGILATSKQQLSKQGIAVVAYWLMTWVWARQLCALHSLRWTTALPACPLRGRLHRSFVPWRTSAVRSFTMFGRAPTSLHSNPMTAKSVVFSLPVAPLSLIRQWHSEAAWDTCDSQQ